MDSKIKKLRENLGKMASMKHKYGLTASSIENYIKDTEHFQVVTPLIGEFSTGKSSLINTLLNRKLLGEGIEPKTAVPTEICYGSQEQAIIYAKDGNTKTLSLDDFQNMELSVEEVKKVQLHIDAPFLNEIDSVKIVDMPGYNSGIELHNRAIDDYLPNSQAYILTFQARTPTIQEDMANFLKELKLHEVPVYLMITKAKSVLEQELKDCVEHIKADAQKYLGLSDVNIGVTNAKGKDKDIAFFEESLRDIAKQSKEIFAKDMELHLAKEGKDLAIYLQTSLKQTDLTPSELEAEIDSAQHNLKSLQDKLENLKNEFNRQLDTCVSNIKGSLASSLDGVAPELENMLVNGLDIRDKLNMVLREAIITAIHEHFDPVYQRYIEKISDTIKVGLSFDSSLQLSEIQVQTDTMLKETLKKAIPVILGAIGLILSGPVGALIAAAVGILVELGFVKKQQHDKNELAHKKIYGEVIPQVTNKAMEQVQSTLFSQADILNKEIGREVQQQVEAQEKALEDIKKRYSEEQEQKNQSIQDMQADLAVVQEMVAQ